jgi:hypothetical protein
MTQVPVQIDTRKLSPGEFNLVTQILTIHGDGFLGGPPHPEAHDIVRIMRQGKYNWGYWSVTLPIQSWQYIENLVTPEV